MKHFIFLASILFSFNCHAQKITIQKTGELKTRTAAGMTFFKDHIFSVESKIKARIGFSAKLDKAKAAIKVKSFSKNGTLIAEKEISGGEHFYGPVEPMFIVLSDSLYLLYSRYSEDEKINIYVARLHAGTLDITGEQNILSFPQKNITLTIFGNSFRFYSLAHATSADGSKTVFFWCNGDNTDFHYSVVDKNFTVLRNGNGSVAGLKKMVVENIFITNDGGFYAGVTFMYYDGGAVIVCNKDEVASVVPLTLSGSAAGSVYVCDKIENDLLNVAGVTLTDNLVTGVYQGSVHIKSKTASNLTVTNLPATIIEKGNKEDYGYAKKNKYGLSATVKMNGYSLPDGTIIIAGDLNRDISTASTAFENLKGPILLGIIRKNGTPLMEYITKRESMGFEKYEHNFYGHVYKGNLLLFYSDAIKNLERPSAETESVKHRGSMENSNAYLKINANGIAEKKIIDSKSQGGYLYSYHQIIPVSENLLLQGLDTQRFEYSDYQREQTIVEINISE